MKKLIGFLLVALMSGAVHAQYNTKVYMQQGGAKQVVLSGGEIEVRTGGLIDLQAGSTLSVNAAATLNIASTPTFSDLTVTYGVAAATAVFSASVNAADLTATDDLEAGDDLRVTGLATVGETLTVTGNTMLGAANYKSTMTASNGNWAITGNVVSLAAVQGATVTGTTSVGVPATGMVFVGLRTIAQLMAATAVAGELGICSDCTPVEVFISTGAGAPNTGGYANAVGLQLD